MVAAQSTKPQSAIDEQVGAFVVLENGTQIPVVSAALGKPPRFLVEVEGFMEGQSIGVLRDTGCSTVVVKSELVPNEKFTGTSAPVFLLDITVRYLPEGIVFIKTPCFTGKVLAKCVSNRIYDPILGNIPLARGADDPDANWLQEDPESTNMQLGRENERDRGELTHGDVERVSDSAFGGEPSQEM